MPDLHIQKHELRTKYLKLRSEIPEDTRSQWDEKIFNTLVKTEDFANCSLVLTYHSIDDECDTTKLIKLCLKMGKKVALPVIKSEHKLIFKRITGVHDLELGRRNIPTPKESCPTIKDFSHSLCIVPGIVFDRTGSRLGYGGGYYDNFLSSYNGQKIGLAYSTCIIDHVPTGKHDEKVNLLLCEHDIIPVITSDTN